MPAAPCVLVVDDEKNIRATLTVCLEAIGCAVTGAATAEAALAAVERTPFDLAFLDLRLGAADGLAVLPQLRARRPGLAIVVVTAYATIDTAVQALKLGAADYLTKPVSLGELKLLIQRLLEHHKLERTVGYYRQRDAQASGLDKVIGNSPAMQTLREQIQRLLQAESHLTDTDAPAVLIHGETGSGKELVARALHFGGPRHAEPFVELNCGAMPAQLVEAELFGYEKGAFTDARQRKPGLVETAEGGTLFLDEIGEADASTQVKLLKLLEDKRFRRLGGLRDQAVNVRIVSATHKDLGAEVLAGRFRQDLYYRLNVIRITVPPLRERIADLPDICAAVLRRIARDAGVSPVPTLDPEALQLLLRYAFPGNVRELENLLHRALALSASSLIERADLGLPEELLQEPAALAESDTLAMPLSPLAVAPAAAVVGSVPLPSDLVAYLDAVERDILERALERHRYNRTAAGASLGLSLRQMRYRMARLGVGAADGEGH